jgi:hypothetical protein
MYRESTRIFIHTVHTCVYLTTYSTVLTCVVHIFQVRWQMQRDSVRPSSSFYNPEKRFDSFRCPSSDFDGPTKHYISVSYRFSQSINSVRFILQACPLSRYVRVRAKQGVVQVLIVVVFGRPVVTSLFLSLSSVVVQYVALFVPQNSIILSHFVLSHITADYYSEHSSPVSGRRSSPPRSWRRDCPAMAESPCRKVGILACRHCCQVLY